MHARLSSMDLKFQPRQYLVEKFRTFMQYIGKRTQFRLKSPLCLIFATSLVYLLRCTSASQHQCQSLSLGELTQYCGFLRGKNI